MKNYVIVAIIIILIIVGVVWFKMKTPVAAVPGEETVTTEPAPLDTEAVAPADASGTPAVAPEAPAAE